MIIKGRIFSFSFLLLVEVRPSPSSFYFVPSLVEGTPFRATKGGATTFEPKFKKKQKT
jgi:hypothetical protein